MYPLRIAQGVVKSHYYKLLLLLWLFFTAVVLGDCFLQNHIILRSKLLLEEVCSEEDINLKFPDKVNPTVSSSCAASEKSFLFYFIFYRRWTKHLLNMCPG